MKDKLQTELLSQFSSITTEYPESFSLVGTDRILFDYQLKQMFRCGSVCASTMNSLYKKLGDHPEPQEKRNRENVEALPAGTAAAPSVAQRCAQEQRGRDSKVVINGSQVESVENLESGRPTRSPSSLGRGREMGSPNSVGQGRIPALRSGNYEGNPFRIERSPLVGCPPVYLGLPVERKAVPSLLYTEVYFAVNPGIRVDSKENYQHTVVNKAVLPSLRKRTGSSHLSSSPVSVCPALDVAHSPQPLFAQRSR